MRHVSAETPVKAPIGEVWDPSEIIQKQLTKIMAAARKLDARCGHGDMG